jgi:hypothetical protein
MWNLRSDLLCQCNFNVRYVTEKQNIDKRLIFFYRKVEYCFLVFRFPMKEKMENYISKANKCIRAINNCELKINTLSCMNPLRKVKIIKMPQRHDPDSYRDSKKHKVFIMNVLRFVMLGDLVPLPCRQAGWWHEKSFSELAHV